MKALLLICFFCSTVFGNLSDSISQFSFDLYHQIDPKEEDVVFSPFSIFTALSMAYIGAKDTTAQEMAQALSLHLCPEPFSEAFSNYLKATNSLDSSLRIANSLWISYDFPILETYRSSLAADFDAAIEAISFQEPALASSRINSWISHKTENKIPNLLSPSSLSTDTKMVLTNAIYFKGAWQKPFPSKNSFEGFFASKPARMLDQTAVFDYLETPEAQIAFLPFRKESPDQPLMAFLLILPKIGTSVELDHSIVTSWIINAKPTRLHLQMPKFKLDKKISPSSLLKALGMETPFTSRADFSGIDGQGRLSLSQIIHQAFFSLDEAGITAAAATAITMATTSLTPPTFPVEMIADRPFTFILLDLNQKTPLFIGRLTHADVFSGD